MNKIKRLFGIALLFAGLISCPVLLTPGCTTSQQETSFNTIYTLEKATTAVYDSYIQQVIFGSIPTNDVPKVSQSFNAFQASMLVALDTVQFNTNALAPANLVIASEDLIRLVRAIENMSKKSKGPL